MPVPHTERKRAGEGEEGIKVIRSFLTEQKSRSINILGND